MKKSTLKFILYNLLTVLAFFLGIEFFLTYQLNHPDKIPNSWLNHFQGYYNTIDRQIIQYQTNFAQYDSGLFYTLKPGNFVFSNREFSNKFKINQAGLRDDEASLKKPKIIVLGDSYAMGWGVEQEETFSELLEKELGEKVLNAAISSYGTPREMKLLSRLDLSQVEYVIIQYCHNDIIENQSFYDNDNQLKISEPNIYSELKKQYAKPNYSFLKHTRLILGSLLNNKEIEKESKENALSQENLFLNVLLQSAILDSVPNIIITHLDYYPSNNFIKNLDILLKSEKHTALSNKIALLDFSAVLDKQHYYILDQHINKKGHQVVFEGIMEQIKQRVNGEVIELKTQSAEKFDHVTSDWNFDENKIKNGLFKMDSLDEWGPGIEFFIKDVELDSGFNSILLNYQIKSKDVGDAMMVIEFYDEENLLSWQGEKTKDFLRTDKGDSLIDISHTISLIPLWTKLKSKNQIRCKIFFWNKSKSNLYLDNMSFALAKGKIKTYNY